MSEFIIPAPLQRGDKVAAVSLSRGTAGECLARYERGKSALEHVFGLNVIAMPHTLRGEDWLVRNPEARAADMMQAFSDRDIRAVITTIGGADSVRIFPFVNTNVLRDNPKILLGYSDNSAAHFMCARAGIRSYYGGGIMTAFAEDGGMFPYFHSSVVDTLFKNSPDIQNLPAPEWTEEWADWSGETGFDTPRKCQPNSGLRLLQGAPKFSGRAVAFCPEVFEMIKFTDLCPPADFWQNAVLFLDVSPLMESARHCKMILRSYGVNGMLNQLNGIVLSRLRTPHQEMGIEQAVHEVVRDEFELRDLPIVANADFGHTDPGFIIPQGINAVVDIERGSIGWRGRPCAHVPI